MPLAESSTQSGSVGTATWWRPRVGATTRPAPAEDHGLVAGPKTVIVYLTAVAGVITTALAWLMPGTVASALLGWLGAAMLVCSMRLRPAYLPAYCGGLIGHAIAFSWIYSTVATFGGFGPIISGLVLGLFVVLGALLFLVFAFFYRNLHPFVDRFALRSAIAMAIAELITIRLFPWHHGHTQIALRPFVQLAGIGGAILVTFVLFWVAEVAVRAIVFQERRREFLVPLVVFGLSLRYGADVTDRFARAHDPEQQVIVVQGNGSLEDVKERDSLERTLRRTYDLTVKSSRPGALIVWPEGAIPAYLPVTIGSVRNDPSLPWLKDGSALLLGAYSFTDPEHRFNSAFAVYPDGSVPSPYCKQILIPFGEYMPGASVFPWLNRMNKNAGVFSAGTEIKVFPFPMQRRDGRAYTVKAAPLICYEDTVPALARRATRHGAELLVNLTYDTWFGRTAAPYQHHLIAAFRAIENRRYLIRSTNSGYTAVVDPLGRTIASIPLLTADTVSVNVRLLSEQTPYTAYLGETPWWLLFAGTTGMIIVGRWRRANR
jgi:apolipoprotein N-acyltransferase